ncbi:MAG: glycosyltransferase family 2 protein [Aquabacterium sp.]|uniref:glycosyltransferase family 2 protein n=1 Tax=Aquabacterium sp. TaxID=1872578 RepID=UPI003BD23CEB
MRADFKIVVGIATAGRREQMPRTLAQLAMLSRQPDRVIVCPATPQDFDQSILPPLPFDVEVVCGPKGLTRQRNVILDACRDEDIILFIDDDFYPASDYLSQIDKLFAAHADVVVATNQPVADGATGPGYSHDQALQILADSHPVSDGFSSDTYGGYGCNMSFRLSVVRQHALRFDENLPLYGWLEDIDFSRRVAPYGRIVNYSGLRGVHLATKAGRTSGLKLGYSQIVNPYYMIRKGSLSFSYGFKHMFKNMAKNLLRSLWQEPWVDRRGRLKGNLFGLIDIAKGRAHPLQAQNLS